MNQLSHLPAATLAPDAYERDFAQWLVRQTELLRAKDFEQLDLVNIIEEIESMGISLHRELESRLRVLLTHLLKCQYQPEHRSSSWMGSIHEQRVQILMLLETSPSLARRVEQLANKSYSHALKRATMDTGLPRDRFPPALPYTTAQLLDEEFYP